METLDRLVERKKDVGGRQKSRSAEGGTLDELFIIVRSCSPCASIADVLFAVYRQMLLYVVGVAVWVTVQTF